MLARMNGRSRSPGARVAARLRPDATTGVAALAGLMATTAQPPFQGTGWLTLPALALLYRALADAPRPGRAGWAFGLAHQASLLHWLFLLGPEAPIAARGLVPATAAAAILYCSLFYLLFGWVLGWVRRRLGRDAALALAPVLWIATEAARAAGELGFPWCLTGAAWIGTPLLPLAAAAGEPGLAAATGLTALAIVAVTELARSRRDGRPAVAWRGAAIACAVVAWLGLVVGAGAGRGSAGGAAVRPAPERGPAPGPGFDAPPPGALRVAAVQADVALADKWDRARIDSTKVPYARLTATAARRGADLAVWAETAVPDYLIHDPELLSWVRHVALDNGIAVFVGYPHASLAPGGEAVLRFNGAGLFGADGRLKDFYAKAHVLPFGERMPFQSLFPFLGKADFGQAEWTPGAPPAPIRLETARGAWAFAPLICYESIFPGLARGAVRRGAGFLVNITNDGWFGLTAGPRQHAELARLRAVECGVPLVRCANNGISFVCDPRGRVIARAGLQERTNVIADIMPAPGRTPFVRLGAWPVAVALALWAGLAVALTRDRTRRTP